MKEYHKIQTIFKRDEKTHRIIPDVFSREEFEYLKDNIWIFTEKVDGTNIRVGWDGNTVSVGGKTDKAQLHSELLSELNRLFPVEKFKSLYPDTPMTLYGEGYGAGIQKGGKYTSAKEFVVFDILINDIWLSRDNVFDIVGHLDIKTVPVIGQGTIANMVEMASSAFKSNWGDFVAEGIVARPAIELHTKRGERIITKIKYKDFLGAK